MFFTGKSNILTILTTHITSGLGAAETTCRPPQPCVFCMATTAACYVFLQEDHAHAPIAPEILRKMNITDAIDTALSLGLISTYTTAAKNRKSINCMNKATLKDLIFIALRIK